MSATQPSRSKTAMAAKRERRCSMACVDVGEGGGRECTPGWAEPRVALLARLGGSVLRVGGSKKVRVLLRAGEGG